MNTTHKTCILPVLTFSFLLIAGTYAHAQANSATGAASVSPDSSTKARGSTVIFTGSDFAMYEPVNIYEGSTYIDTVYTNMYGGFKTRAYTLPLSVGNVRFSFRGLKAGDFVESDISVDSSDQRWISLDTYIASAGKTMTLYGHNYASNEPVKIWYSGQFVGAGQADGKGNFNIMFFVPETNIGQKIVSATGDWDNVGATANLTQVYGDGIIAGNLR